MRVAIVVLLATASSTASAQLIGDVEEASAAGVWIDDPAFLQISLDYQSELLQRTQTSAHYSSLLDELGSLSGLISDSSEQFTGRVIASGTVNGNELVLVWNDDLRQMLLYDDGVRSELVTQEDEFGRVAFFADEHYGWFDFSSERYFVDLDETVQVWSEANEPGTNAVSPGRRASGKVPLRRHEQAVFRRR